MKRFYAALVLIAELIAPSLVHGQPVSMEIGIGGGVPLIKSVQNPPVDGFAVTVSTNVDRPPYVVGTVLQLTLGSQFSIEADALYRPVQLQIHET
jgi:hypothetical protein